MDFVSGDATGLAIPAHSDAMRDGGAAFLTAAFRRFGSLSPENRVTRITQLEPFSGGNSGHKLLLSVDYEHADARLHRELFVKFSRDFTDAFRDRRRYELEAEVHFATLSRLADFPIKVAEAYFADFNHESGTGILITQRIAFGQGGIEPLHPKCRDHDLREPLAYYRAIVTTLARLAGAHKSGRIAAQVAALFPFSAEAAAAEDPIPWDERQLRDLVGRYAVFAATSPRLLPAHLSTPGFIDRLERDAVRFLHHEQTIKRFLNADRDFIALCHYNANIDNAWFWRNQTGELQCGLLDWGRVRQMNVANSLCRSLCAADLGTWNEHLDELLLLFVEELRAQGGPCLEVEDLRLRLHCYVAMAGLGMMMQTPALVLSRLPAAAGADSPLDPVFNQDSIARGFLHVFTSFLNLWETGDFGATLDRVLKIMGVPAP
jgi:hypothetical protein